MRSATVWFLVLAGVCVVGPYILGVPPKTRRQWLYVGLTLALLAWMLPLMVSLYSK